MTAVVNEIPCTPLILLSGNAKIAGRLKICFVVEFEQRHHFYREVFDAEWKFCMKERKANVWQLGQIRPIVNR